MKTGFAERRRFIAQARRICAEVGMRRPDGRRLFDPRRNRLLLGPEEAAAVSVPGGCALTGTLGGRGGFSTLYADSPEAAGELADALVARHAAWGSEEIEGPVRPSLADLNGGLYAGGPETPDAAFWNGEPVFLARALEKRGFEVSRRMLLYRMDFARCDLPCYERVAAYAARRFGLDVVTAKQMGERAACHAMARALCVGGEGRTLSGLEREMAGVLGELGRLWSPSLTQIALCGGGPVGFLLALDSGSSVRVATAHVVPGWRNRAVTAVMGAPLLRRVWGRRVELGVIDESNLASRLSVERAGARMMAEFHFYHMKIKNI